MKRFFSKLSPKYSRSLVYMLQATEYYPADFWPWYRKVKDFRRVELTGSLKKTKKALVLLAFAWIETLFIYALFITFLLLALEYPIYSFIGIAFLFFLGPIIIADGIVIFLFILKTCFQSPYEYFLAKKLTGKIAKLKATKIAIAGSYGKTSMREILKTVLSEGKKVAAPPSSYNTLGGINRFVNSLTGKEDILIFELGEYVPGDIKKLCKIIKPDIGFITGINEAHLKRFKTIEKTVKTIYELVDFLDKKPVYINSENALSKNNARGNYKLYSNKGCGDWKTVNAKSDLDGTFFDLKRGDNKYTFKSKLLGLHQLGPLVATIDLAETLGYTTAQIKKGIEATKPFQRRLEYKSKINGVITLDDSYNGNPDGAEAVINFLGSIKNHRRIYITSGLVEMGDKNIEVHHKIGTQLAKVGIEKILLVKTTATPYIADGLEKADYKGEILWFDDTESAYRALPHLTVSGDVVLLQNDWPDQYNL